MKKVTGIFSILACFLVGFIIPVFGQAGLHIQLPDTTVELEESTILMPVYIQDLPDDSISGFKLKVQFDPDVVAIESFSKATTLSSGFTIFGNKDSDESFIISGAGSSPIHDDGILIYLEVLINGAGTSPLEFLEIEINEGEPSFTSTNGRVTVGTPVPIPATPGLISPGSGEEQVNISPTLSWENISEADTYEVQLSVSDDFSSLIIDETSASNSLAIESLEYLSQYFWRVKAVNESGESEWSETFSFTTKEKENVSPVVQNPLGSLHLNEDFGTEEVEDLKTVFSDEETEILDFEITNTVDFLDASLEDGKLIFTSKDDLYGEGSIVIRAMDEKDAEVSDTLQVTVQPINDLPVFDSLPDTLTFVSGEELIFEFGEFITDVEDELEDLTIHFTTEPEMIDVDVVLEEHSITLMAPDFSGKGKLMIEVIDSDGGELEGSININVETSTSTENDQNIPTEYTLSQNYPNPFNPSTVIRYQLPVNSNVRLEVFDMAGRAVYSQLYNQKPAGIYTITFDASSHSSGVYIYRLKAGDFVETRKMILIK